MHEPKTTKPNFPVPGPTSGAVAQPEIVKTHTLISGKVLTILRPLGKHQRLALAQAGDTPDKFKIMHALMSQLCRLDGKPIPMEAFDNMDLGDVMEIEEEVTEYANPLLKRRRQKVKEVDADSQPS